MPRLHLGSQAPSPACSQVSSQSSPGSNLHLSPNISEEGVGIQAGSEADEAAKNLRKARSGCC